MKALGKPSTGYICVFFLVVLFSLLALSAEEPKREVADLRWLENHPYRSVLSAGAELTLKLNLQYWRERTQARSSRTAPPKTEGSPRASYINKPSQDPSRPGPYVVDSLVNLRVNNPAGDIGPSTQSEASIAVFGQRVVVGYNDSSTNVPADNNFAGYAFSSDGGSTFVDAGTIPQMPGTRNGGDPVVAADVEGNFYYATLVRDEGTFVTRIGVAKSVDGGETFSAPVIASAGSVVGSIPFLDKPWMAIDKLTGNIHVMWTRFQTNRVDMQYSVSTNGGQTFSSARNLRTFFTATDKLVGAQLAIGINGEVYGAWERQRDDNSADIEFCQIPASGACTVTAVASSIPRIGVLDPSCGTSVRVLNASIRNRELPSLAVDNSTGTTRGNLYLVWNQSTGSLDQSSVFISRLAGGQGAWSTPVRVKTSNRDQFMPSVAVTDRGTVAVTYYSRELDPNNRLINVFTSTSNNAGATFTSQRVTSVSFDVPPLNPNFDLAFPPCYMGDYNQTASDGESFYLAWGDNRNILNQMPNPDVFHTAVSDLPESFFAQVANGEGWQTSFFMTNLDAANDAQVRLELFRANGTNFNVLPGTTNTATLTLNPAGTAVIATIGGGTAEAGWARLTTLTPSRAGFSALSQFSSGGSIVSEVGFSASKPFKRGVFLIERESAMGRDTAVAIANQSGSQSTTVTLKLRNTAGTQVGTTKTINLSARNQTAQFITQLFPGQVPASFEGTLLLESSATNIAANVRSDNSANQHTNFPVFRESSPLVTYFADIVNGSGWTTDLAFANGSDTSPATVTVQTFQQNGSAWPILPGPASLTTFSLSARGSRFTETIGGTTFARGWAKITTNSRELGSFQVHQFTSGGVIVQEAGDQSRNAQLFSQTFAVRSATVNTGFSICNDSGDNAEVIFELFNSSGTSQGATSLMLVPGEQVARNLSGLFPAVGSVTGSVRISSESPVAIRVIRLDGLELVTYPVF